MTFSLLAGCYLDLEFVNTRFIVLAQRLDVERFRLRTLLAFLDSLLLRLLERPYPRLARQKGEKDGGRLQTDAPFLNFSPSPRVAAEALLYVLMYERELGALGSLIHYL